MSHDTPVPTNADLAARLKESRKRTGLSAEAAAELGGISRATQFTYENGTNLPDAMYLARLHVAGLDVQYVLTGQAERKTPDLTEQERTLLDRFTQMPPQMQRTVEDVVLLAWLAFDARRAETAEPSPPPKPPKKRA